MCAEERKLLHFDLCLLNLNVAVVFQGEQDGIAQAKANLATLDVSLQMRRGAKSFSADARREHSSIALI